MPLPSAGDIAQWLLDELGELEKAPSGLRVRPADLRRPYSKIYQAQLPGFDTAVAIKVCIDLATQSPSWQAAREQYVALCRLQAAATRNGSYRSLKPYPLLQQHGCVVTEWVTSDTLETRLTRWVNSSHNMVRDVQATGQWLRYFHDDGCVGNGFLETDLMISQIEAAAARSSHSHHRFEEIQQGIELLKRTAGAAGLIKLPVSWVHGDFKTSNVLFTGTEPVAIDLDLSRESVIIHDLAQFLFELKLLALEPRGLRLMASRKAVVDGFLRGYFGAANRIPPLPLCWTLLQIALRIWLARKNLNYQNIRIRFLCWRIQRIIPQLILDLSTAAG
jgi:hypothetical protein